MAGALQARHIAEALGLKRRPRPHLRRQIVWQGRCPGCEDPARFRVWQSGREALFWCDSCRNRPPLAATVREITRAARGDG